MKTTLNLPDGLVQTIKMRAVLNKRTLQDTIAELLIIGLAHSDESASPPVRRVSLPILKGGVPIKQLSPAEISQLLDDQEFRDLN